MPTPRHDGQAPSLNRGTDFKPSGYDTRGALSVIPKMPLRSQREPDAMRPAPSEATTETCDGRWQHWRLVGGSRRRTGPHQPVARGCIRARTHCALHQRNSVTSSISRPCCSHRKGHRAILRWKTSRNVLSLNPFRLVASRVNKPRPTSAFRRHCSICWSRMGGCRRPSASTRGQCGIDYS